MDLFIFDYPNYFTSNVSNQDFKSLYPNRHEHVAPEKDVRSRDGR